MKEKHAKCFIECLGVAKEQNQITGNLERREEKVMIGKRRETENEGHQYRSEN